MENSLSGAERHRALGHYEGPHVRRLHQILQPRPPAAECRVAVWPRRTVTVTIANIKSGLVPICSLECGLNSPCWCILRQINATPTQPAVSYISPDLYVLSTQRLISFDQLHITLPAPRLITVRGSSTRSNQTCVLVLGAHKEDVGAPRPRCYGDRLRAVSPRSLYKRRRLT